VHSPAHDHGANENEATSLLNDFSHQVDAHGEVHDPLGTRLQGSSQCRVQHLSQKREGSHFQQREEDRERILLKKVPRRDGTMAEVIVGQSTLPGTIFHCSNVLIGIGMLGLPLGMRHADWVISFRPLVLSPFVTKYTASLLVKCLDVDSSLASFADIAFVAFGEDVRLATSILFTFELAVACISLVILFADSLGSLIDGLDSVHWKILCG
jgi:solute carrier family 32 (vesicular inhibitory amino acid transporter)